MRPLKPEQFAGMNLLYSRTQLTDFLDSVYRMGIKNIELWTQTQFFCELYKSTSDTKRLKCELDARDLKLVCFIPEQCTWPFNIASHDKKIRQESCDYYLRHIETAKELGAPKVLVTPGWYEWDLNREDGLLYSEESLFRLLPYFQQAGITPVLELLQPCESNLMYDLKTTGWYAEHFSEKEMNFCIDTVPLTLAGEKLEDYFRVLGKRIRHIHLIDGTPAGHLVLGDGEQDIREHIETMERWEYRENITLEFGASIYYRDPDFHMKRGWNYLKKLLAEVRT